MSGKSGGKLAIAIGTGRGIGTRPAETRAWKDIPADAAALLAFLDA